MTNIKFPTLQMNYFREADIRHLLISEEPEAGSIEISPNITADLNDAGELIGIEILNANAYKRISSWQNHSEVDVSGST
ncbi:MAG: DUF2283 domain-containing protein [Leptolyngbyaceae cyanobacterium]